jgi:hypothetical protein
VNAAYVRIYSGAQTVPEAVDMISAWESSDDPQERELATSM